jgi:ATP-dependent DNA helicase 2 subunit 2
MLMPDVRQCRNNFVASKTNSGDPLSALILALHMTTEHCKRLKYIKNIYLITNGRSPIEIDDTTIPQVVSKLKEENVSLNVIGVDFDDENFGFVETNKDEEKAETEEILKNLVEQSDGIFGTMAEAIAEMQQPRVKEIRKAPLFKGLLMLGDGSTFETAMTIDVEAYPRVMIDRPPTASNYVVRSNANPAEGASFTSSNTMNSEEDHKNDLAAVKTSRGYKVEDPNAPGGKRDVSEDELDKGFEYGRSAVHFSEDDQQLLGLETSPGIDIIGFVPWDGVGHHQTYLF